MKLSNGLLTLDSDIYRECWLLPLWGRNTNNSTEWQASKLMVQTLRPNQIADNINADCRHDDDGWDLTQHLNDEEEAEEEKKKEDEHEDEDEIAGEYEYEGPGLRQSYT